MSILEGRSRDGDVPRDTALPVGVEAEGEPPSAAENQQHRSKIPVFDLEGRDPELIVRHVRQAHLVARLVTSRLGSLPAPEAGKIWVITVFVTQPGEYDAAAMAVELDKLRGFHGVDLDSQVKAHRAPVGEQPALYYYREGEFYLGEIISIAARPATMKGGEADGPS